MVSDVKVAFCISGEPRMYKKCYSRFRKHINLLKNEAMEGHGCKVTVDIFIHSWDRTSTYRNNDPAFTKKEKIDSKQHIQYDIKELRDDLIEKYNPKRILVESKDVAMDALHKYYVDKGYLRYPKSGNIVDIKEIKESNYLALMQHISGERSAYLKSDTDIICQSEDIIGDPVINDYDIVIKTRTDIVYSTKYSHLWDIITNILDFNKRDKYKNGISIFPKVTLRNGNVWVSSIAHWWSNNKQFDMYYDNLVEKLFSYDDVDFYTIDYLGNKVNITIYENYAQHLLIGYHLQKLDLTVEAWATLTGYTGMNDYIECPPIDLDDFDNTELEDIKQRIYDFEKKSSKRVEKARQYWRDIGMKFKDQGMGPR